MDTCICVTESLCCLPETTLLIGYTPVQNKNKIKTACLKKKKQQTSLFTNAEALFVAPKLTSNIVFFKLWVMTH